MTETAKPADAFPPPMQRVRFITSGEAVPGMTMAFMIQAVRNSQLFKLSAGVVLTAELIDQLRRRQVNCLAITIDETRDIGEISRHLLDSQEQIQSVFSLLEPADFVGHALYSSLMEYRLGFN
jgi:hypothetical protein